jgi:hypothetical protein
MSAERDRYSVLVKARGAGPELGETRQIARDAAARLAGAPRR